MIRHPLFLLYGLGLIGLASVAEFNGWTFSSARQVNNVPRSVRDNPGAYRSIYGNYYRYSGGK
jgi:hypothetical protein